VFEFCSGYTLYVPNAITPNNDGVNDVFKAVGSHIADFEMVIWDRWGMKVFETTNIYEGWTGNVSEGNHYVPSDVFGYHIRYRYIEEDSGTLSSWQDINGQVTVIR
jgi:gliding motility-associated-like protein